MTWQSERMKHDPDVSEDLSRRIDLLAARSTLTRERIIEEALSHGRSLAWQEKWVAGVLGGIEAADRDDFATEEEIAAVLNGYGKA
jgi:predicted transcriptional regulator